MRPPKRSVSMPSGKRTSDPLSTGVAASRPNWVSLSCSRSLMGTPSTANIIQIMKQMVNAAVLIPSTSPCCTLRATMSTPPTSRCHGRRLVAQAMALLIQIKKAASPPRL
ncbi:hypothetical protein D3C84_828350 [compost metagenome]